MIKNIENDSINTSMYGHHQAQISWDTSKEICKARGKLINTLTNQNVVDTGREDDGPVTLSLIRGILKDLKSAISTYPDRMKDWRPAVEDLERKVDKLVFTR